MNIWSILDRYGLPLAMLCVVMFAIYKLVWPLLLSQIEGSRATLITQLEAANKRLDNSQASFLKALEDQNTVMQDGFSRLERLTVAEWKKAHAPEKHTPRVRRSDRPK